MDETTTHPHIGTDQQEISPGERLALIGRIAEGSQLKRSARLRQFLIYVGRRSVLENSASIHEQEIGAVVFGRPESYDTNLDNIVRVNATELRKRLESYFAAEGADEPIVVQIPRGGYTPVFVRRTVTDAPSASVVAKPEEITTDANEPPHEEVLADDSEHDPAPKKSRTPLLIVAFVFVALAALCVLLFWQSLGLRRQLAPWKNGAVVASFWSTFFDSVYDTDIILADTSYALAEDISGHEFRLDDYLNYAYMHVTQDPSLTAEQRADLTFVLERNNGSAGDFRVADQITALNPVSTKLRLQFSREYTPDELKHNNVVLIGGPQSNPWVELFDPQLNFSLQYDVKRHLPYIINRHTKPGEQPLYEGVPGLGSTNGYSIIAFLPNLNHTASILILEGTGSQATNAAGDFITSERRLTAFTKMLPSGNIPYFEILLRTSHLVGTSLHSEIVAYRTYPRDATANQP